MGLGTARELKGSMNDEGVESSCVENEKAKLSSFVAAAAIQQIHS